MPVPTNDVIQARITELGTFIDSMSNQKRIARELIIQFENLKMTPDPVSPDPANPDMLVKEDPGTGKPLTTNRRQTVYDDTEARAVTLLGT